MIVGAIVVDTLRLMALQDERDRNERAEEGEQDGRVVAGDEFDELYLDLGGEG